MSVGEMWIYGIYIRFVDACVYEWFESVMMSVWNVRMRVGVEGRV